MGNVVINNYMCVCVWMGGLVCGCVCGGDTLGVQAGYVLNFKGHKGGKYLCFFTSRRNSSIVSDCFDAIPILQLSHTTQVLGWRSATCVHSVLYLEYHHLWGHNGYLGEHAPLAPLSNLPMSLTILAI